MFEILKALLAVQEACRNHHTSLRWEIADTGHGLVLQAEIPVTEDDQRFVQDMQRMFEEVE